VNERVDFLGCGRQAKLDFRQMPGLFQSPSRVYSSVKFLRSGLRIEPSPVFVAIRSVSCRLASVASLGSCGGSFNRSIHRFNSSMVLLRRLFSACRSSS
jgi:hypothetical protein